MVSPEGEEIKFRGKVIPCAKGEIEVWLLQFQDAMKDQLKKRMSKGK